MKKITDTQLADQLDSSDHTEKPLLSLTGGTGFVGESILNCALKAGWRVRALYRPKKGRKKPETEGVEWLAGDLSDKDVLRKLLSGSKAIIHCAGVVRGATQEEFDAVNEDGARQIADIAARLLDKPRLLLISSLAAREPELSHYATSKWRGECAVKSLLDSNDWTIIRPPAVYGPGDKEMLPLFKGMANGVLTVPSGSDGRFSLIYVDDLADAIITCLFTDSTRGMTIELDDGREGGYHWDLMIEIASKVLREGRPVYRLPIPLFILNSVARINLEASKVLGYAPMLTPGKVREITHSDWVSDTGKFTEISGWKPNIGLELGLTCIFDKKA